jgi:hypothetical protein
VAARLWTGFGLIWFKQWAIIFLFYFLFFDVALENDSVAG